jgi:hypothetical protein
VISVAWLVMTSARIPQRPYIPSLRMVCEPMRNRYPTFVRTSLHRGYVLHA